MILLNKLTFNNTSYDITDKRLFSSDTIHNKTTRLVINNVTNGDGNNATNSLIEVCTTNYTMGYHCGTPDYEGCRNSPAGCDFCGTQCYLTVNEWEYCWNEEPIGNPPYGGTGGGTGGGGQIPHQFPCIPTSGPPIPFSGGNNVLPGDPLPPCPLPGSGTGWNPSPPFDINNPCNVIDSLMKTNNFPIYYNILRNNVNLNYEKGFLFFNPFLPTTTYIDTSGLPGVLGLSMNPLVPVDGTVHSHYIDSLSLSVFSFDDFTELHKWYTTGKIANIKSFTFGMVSDSTSYIMMITDPVAFTNFGNLYFSDPENTTIFKYAFYDGYGINESKTDADNEKSFLNALQGLNSGISLFKGNSTISNFSRIKVNESNQVRPWPCN